MNNLSEAQLREYKDLFTFFDRDKDTKVSKEDLKVVMGEVGLRVDDNKIFQMIQDINLSGQPFGEGEFLNQMAVKLKNTSNPATLKHAFEAFDPEKKGYVAAPELKKYLQTWGDRLDDKDWQQILKEIDCSATDLFYYDKFISLLTNTGGN